LKNIQSFCAFLLATQKRKLYSELAYFMVKRARRVNAANKYTPLTIATV
jgi:hypothetical protein